MDNINSDDKSETEQNKQDEKTALSSERDGEGPKQADLLFRVEQVVGDIQDVFVGD